MSADDGLIYGYKPVVEALEADPSGIESLMIDTGRKRGLKRVELAARRGRVRILRMTEAELNARCGHGNHQGLAATVAPIQTLDLDALVERLASRTEATVLALDQLQDPQNLGAILRTAGALGVDGVITPDRRACPINATVVRASAGVARRVPIAQVTNLRDALDRLKQVGFWISGAVADQGQAPWTVDLGGRVALVLGSEGRGIRPRVLDGCDFRLTIPLAAEVESLNVGAAAAALLFEIRRQRLIKQGGGSP